MTHVEVITRPPLGVDRPAFDVDFCNLPDRVRRDPYRAGLPNSSFWQELLNMSGQLKSRFWVARVRGESIARLGANLLTQRPDTGGVGFFEADVQHPLGEQAALILLQEAREWLRSQGARQAYGPLNFNTWFPHRFRVAPLSGDERNWEPVNPPEYPEWFRKAGFAPDDESHSTCLDDLEIFIERTRAGFERARAAGFSFRPIRIQDFLGSEIALLYRISMEVFRGDALFETIPFDMFRALYAPLVKKFDFGLSRFALDPSGREVGFCFNIADENSLVLRTAAVPAACRRMGLSSALAFDAASAARELGLSRVIMALVRKGFPIGAFSRKARGTWRHDYALFKTVLS